jgi:hypothetical protein
VRRDVEQQSSMRATRALARLAFPPRITPEGVRISSMNPVDAAEAVARILAARASAESKSSAAASTLVQSWMTSRTRAVRAITHPRVPEDVAKRVFRPLSALECDMVELGGALP